MLSSKASVTVKSKKKLKKKTLHIMKGKRFAVWTCRRQEDQKYPLPKNYPLQFPRLPKTL